jgi:hypothetical protein
MQREHVVMLTREDLVADLNDQLMALVVKPLAVMIGIRGPFLQDGVGGNRSVMWFFPSSGTAPWALKPKNAGPGAPLRWRSRIAERPQASKMATIDGIAIARSTGTRRAFVSQTKSLCKRC